MSHLLNRLAARLALAIMCTSVVLFVTAVLVFSVPNGLVPAVVSGVLTGPITYAIAHVMLVRRLSAARELLRQARKHELEAFTPGKVAVSDELDRLLWQIYRTGKLFDHQVKELRTAEKLRREFLANISHELKTPLFAIQGFAETLLDGALDDARVNRGFVEKILHNSARLNRLVRDLSEISRLESGTDRLHQEPFAIGRLVSEVLASLEPLSAERQVTISSGVPDALPPVLADRERIRQVLSNLVDNAVKYNSPGGAVTVRVEPVDDEQVHISVHDTGIGIAPADIPRLTERFYRADRSRSREQGGSGLGLAIIKHILVAHGRKLHIESKPGEGSTFSFTLPLAGSRGQLRVHKEAADPNT